MRMTPLSAASLAVGGSAEVHEGHGLLAESCSPKLRGAPEGFYGKT